MYLIEPGLGFFSIVAVPPPRASGASAEPAPDLLAVRARDPEHLARLQARLPEALGAFDVVETPERDYPCRITIPRAAWVRAMTDLAAGHVVRNVKAEALRAFPRDAAFVAAVRDTHARFERLQHDAAVPRRIPSPFVVHAQLRRLARSQRDAIVNGEDDSPQAWEAIGAFAALAYAAGLWHRPLSPDVDDPPGTSVEFSVLVARFLAVDRRA